MNIYLLIAFLFSFAWILCIQGFVIDLEISIVSSLNWFFGKFCMWVCVLASQNQRCKGINKKLAIPMFVIWTHYFCVWFNFALHGSHLEFSTILMIFSETQILVYHGCSYSLSLFVLYCTFDFYFYFLNVFLVFWFGIKMEFLWAICCCGLEVIISW